MDQETAKKPLSPCPGIEIVPGHFSGCTAAETGSDDCPVCTPNGAMALTAESGTPKSDLAESLDARIGRGL